MPKMNLGYLILLPFVLIGLASMGNEKNRETAINWDGPVHLLDDFANQKACAGLQAVVRISSNRFTIHIRQDISQIGGYTVRGRYYWAVFDPKGKLLKKGSTMRGKNAVKDACKTIRKIDGQKIRAAGRLTARMLGRFFR